MSRGPDGVVAIGANFVNKSAMLLLPHQQSVVLLLQLVTMYCTVQAIKGVGLVAFPPFSLLRFRQLLPLSLAYAAHAALVLRSLAQMNVAVYNTLKRLTPVLVLVFKAAYERKAPGGRESCCVALVVSGCIMAGAGDMSFSVAGYSTALVCSALQAVYILLAEANDRRNGKSAKPGPGSRSGAGHLPRAASFEGPAAAALLPGDTHVPGHPREGGLSRAPSGGSGTAASVTPRHDDEEAAAAIAETESNETTALLQSGGLSAGGSGSHAASLPGLSSTAEVLFYASVSALPLLVVFVLLSREADSLPKTVAGVCGQLGGWRAFVPWLVMVAFVETALAGTLVWCTECNGGLTTSIIGVIKGVAAIALGLVFMAGPSRLTLLNLCGIFVVLLGGTGYSILQFLPDKGGRH